MAKSAVLYLKQYRGQDRSHLAIYIYKYIYIYMMHYKISRFDVIFIFGNSPMETAFWQIEKLMRNTIPLIVVLSHRCISALITRFVGPTWGLPEADETQVGPVLAPWPLLSGMLHVFTWLHSVTWKKLACNSPIVLARVDIVACEKGLELPRNLHKCVTNMMIENRTVQARNHPFLFTF